MVTKLYRAMKKNFHRQIIDCATENYVYSVIKYEFIIFKLNVILLDVKNNNYNTYIIIPTHLLEVVLKNVISYNKHAYYI